jgi:metal-responsive CopG/Arc/MetJ family transcriptional regulator
MEKKGRQKKPLINIKADQEFIARLDAFWQEEGYPSRTDFILKTLERRMAAKEMEAEVYNNVVVALRSEEIEPHLKKAVLHAMGIQMGVTKEDHHT